MEENKILNKAFLNYGFVSRIALALAGRSQSWDAAVTCTYAIISDKMIQKLLGSHIDTSRRELSSSRELESWGDLLTACSGYQNLLITLPLQGPYMEQVDRKLASGCLSLR